MSTGRGRSLRGLTAAGAVALLVTMGLVAWWLLRPAPAGSMDAGPEHGPAAASPTTEPGLPRPVYAERRPGAPRRVVIPALGVDAPVRPVQAPNDTLVPPADARRLGWWADGAMPGAARGSALVAGHSLHAGGGALQHLERLASGDRVVVRTDSDRITYEVASVRVYGKGLLAREAERVFSQEVPGRLVLVTCEDWDGTQYLSNVVVVARPLRR
jgi:LPXTG-site transpeptidase (sortase) family protein